MPFRTYRLPSPLDQASATISQVLATYCASKGWRCSIQQSGVSVVYSQTTLARIVWHNGPELYRTVTAFSVIGLQTTEVLVLIEDLQMEMNVALMADLDEIFSVLRDRYAYIEEQAIRDSLPLLQAEMFSSPPPMLAQLALIIRGHVLEDLLALVDVCERSGVEPKMIFVLSKGDETLHNARLMTTFQHRGYYTDVLDTFDTNVFAQQRLQTVLERITSFCEQAHRAGKEVAVIDDGGAVLHLLQHQQHEFLDYVIEDTVGGVNRLSNIPHLTVPVYDIAHSDLKTAIIYPELGTTIVERLYDLIGAEKLRGRSVVLVGYGSLGRSIASALRNRGCLVAVHDKSTLPLIEAAEQGMPTFRSVRQAVRSIQPFLLIGSTGQPSITVDDLDELPAEAYVTAVAANDLAALRFADHDYQAQPIPEIGIMWVRPDGSRFYQLGDGRSINLFRSESLPNRVVDVFKAGILVVVRSLCTPQSALPPGIHVGPVNTAIAQSGLLDRYYDRYWGRHRENS